MGPPTAANRLPLCQRISSTTIAVSDSALLSDCGHGGRSRRQHLKARMLIPSTTDILIREWVLKDDSNYLPTTVPTERKREFTYLCTDQ